MKKYLIISLTLILFLIFKNDAFAQLTPSKPEIGKWQLKDDPNSFWEFKNDGKMYSSYTGNTEINVFTYSISDTPPTCQEGVTLAVRKKVNYLTLKFDKYNTISCFYIYGLNNEIFTVMDAETGHTLPFTKVED
ncbi:MAG: hypothetical protein AAFQ94_22165 [Bacteroidota bacterium]